MRLQLSIFVLTFVLFMQDAREEKSLYAFLAQVRLNNALDELRELRCVHRSGAAGQRTLPHETSQPKNRNLQDLIRTYSPPLDDLVSETVLNI